MRMASRLVQSIYVILLFYLFSFTHCKLRQESGFWELNNNLEKLLFKFQENYHKRTYRFVK